jgi:hypothetical protein
MTTNKHETGECLTCSGGSAPRGGDRTGDDRPPHFPVTDDDLDAPDGAEVDGYRRVGDTWYRIDEKNLGSSDAPPDDQEEACGMLLHSGRRCVRAKGHMTAYHWSESSEPPKPGETARPDERVSETALPATEEEAAIADIVALWAGDVARAVIDGVNEATIARLIAKAYVDGQRAERGRVRPTATAADESEWLAIVAAQRKSAYERGLAEGRRERATPTAIDATVVESIRAEERERCAKALEVERERVADEQGGMLGEMVVYDICALHIRQLAGGQN